MLVRIKKGKHNEVNPFKTTFPYLHFGRTNLRFKIMFDENCFLQDNNWNDSVNKIIGLSFNNLPFELNHKWHRPHHLHSFRIGWRLKNGVTELVAYQYVFGKRIITRLVTVLPGIWYTVHVSFEYANKDYFNRVVVKIGSYYVTEHQEHKLTFSFTTTKSYLLGAFFGGQEPAPQDLSYQFEWV